MSSFVTDWAQSDLSGALRNNVVDKAKNAAIVRETAELGKFLTNFQDLKKILDWKQEHKLRRLLNHFLSPSVMPKFTTEVADVPVDKDLIHGLPASQEVQTPLRMIDIVTKNMVDTFPLGPDDQYCIVSHSWKGSEIDYQYFMRAKQLDPVHLGMDKTTDHNDIDLVIAQCEKDLREVEAKVLGFLPELGLGSIEELLEKYLKAKAVQKDLTSAESETRRATAYQKKAAREAAYYPNLVKNVHISQELEKGSDAEDKQKAAQVKENECKEARASHDKLINLFEKRRRESYIIEDLLSALQRNKSLRKILNSIKRTNEIFESRPFPRRGKKYVWLDTCCINKANVNEYTMSMPLMGDWYTNADLCLVHLDTKRSDAEWVNEWKYWKQGSEEFLERNIDHYEQITEKYNKDNGQKVEWATRGWTLQELVLSKTTFYVNSLFEPLYRDIERIGPYYHFCRFIRPYYEHSACHRFDKGILESNLRELAQRGGKQDDVSRVENAHRIIGLLEEFRFTAPKHIMDLTAKALIEDAVTTAIEATGAEHQNVSLAKREEDREFLAALCKRLVTPENQNQRKIIIDLLLQALAIETKPVICKDRNYISEFGQVETLGGWKKDISPDKFSARSVMMTASDRFTTVPVDQVYSLMGILGVRFPVFSAEGVPKALARLLDEVVITSNDVSVFNWAGRHSGSPVQGRSLYPSNIKAFNMDVSPINKAVVNTIRAEHLQKSEITGRLNSVLINAFSTVKHLDNKCTILPSVEMLIMTLRKEKFTTIAPCLGRIEKLVKEMTELVMREQKRKDEEKRRKETEIEEEKRRKENEEIMRQEESKEKQRGKEQEQNKEAGLFKMKKFKAPSFKLPDTPSIPSALKLAKEDDQSSKPQGADSEKGPQGGDEKPQDDLWKELTEKVNSINVDLVNIAQKDEKPSFDVGERSQPPRVDESAEQETKMICPNPIAVTSAGIRGVFDIQRVIVTMQDVEALRANVANAISGQYIDGWCTISTGFAYTLVAFSCERDVLKQQLDMADVINRELSTGDDPSKDVQTPEGKASTGNEGNGSKTASPEQKRLRRMLQFVQESDLHSIAGEWVLARFSSVEGAKWFLCRLELGSGNDFYARRISTDAFTFVNAIPEQGLIQYWDQFMWNKKALACWVLSSYLDSKTSGRSAAETLKRFEDAQQRSRQEDNGTGGKSGDSHNANELTGSTGSDVPPRELARMVKNFIIGEVREWWGDHLASNIEVDAMGKIPVRIQGAIADLDKGRSLLPSMFHSGREIHMF